MTMQGAKGLEARTVCVTGLEEGALPNARATAARLAEQARLLFVAMTRAKCELYLFHARTRPEARPMWHSTARASRTPCAGRASSTRSLRLGSSGTFRGTSDDTRAGSPAPARPPPG